MSAGNMGGHISSQCTMEPKAKSCYTCQQEGHIVCFWEFCQFCVIYPKVFSLATAPKKLVVAEASVEEDSQAPTPRSATAAASLATLLAHALKPILREATTSDTEVVEVVEAALAQRLGLCFVVLHLILC
jgi:hypothetical protein